MLKTLIGTVTLTVSISSLANETMLREPSNDMSMLPQVLMEPMGEPDSLKYYLSLRPRFGTSNTQTQAWKVDDSSSRTGVVLRYTLVENLRLIVQGDIRPTLQSDYEFGSSRKAYLGIEGHWGQVTYGKQNVAQYNFIAEPVDIFNRLSSPLGYDIISPARVNSLVSYQLDIGNWNVQLDKRMHNQARYRRNQYLGGGGKYHWKNMYFAAAYYQEEIQFYTQRVYGLSFSHQVAEDVYWATSLQHTQYRRDKGITADVAISYQFIPNYKFKLGVSNFKPDSVRRTKQKLLNVTFEWFQTDKLKWFVEWQLIHKKNASENQVFLGFRFDFTNENYR